MLRGAKRRGNPFPARHRRADGTSGTPSPTERFDALMRRAGCPHPAARQTKAPAINGGGLRAGRPTRNPAAVRPLMRAGRGSEFHPVRGIPKRKTTQRVVFLFVITHRFCCSHPRISQGRGSVRGEPLTGFPTRVQSPARRRPILRSKIDEARTRFPASHEWQSHSQEPCLYLWI